MTKSSKNELTYSIRNTIQAILGFDIDANLVKDERLREFSFATKREEFHEAFSLLKQLKEATLETTPYHLLVWTNQQLIHFHGLLETIAKFSIPMSQYNSADIYQQRDKLIEGYDQLYPTLFELTLKILSYSRVGNQNASIVDEIREIEKIKENVMKESADASAKIKTVMETLQAESKDLGISKYSAIFKSQSDSHRKIAQRWLLWTWILIAGAFAYGFYLNGSIDELKSDLTNNNYVLLVTITRVLIITVLFLAISQSVRNYKSHKHNEVVNQHRHNALTTFETFSTAASSDSQTQNAVLIEATRSIFANQNSGYTSNDSDNEVPTSKIIEVIKSTKK